MHQTNAPERAGSALRDKIGRRCPIRMVIAGRPVSSDRNQTISYELFQFPYQANIHELKRYSLTKTFRFEMDAKCF
ncbi:hypothetical protein [Burkholderia thailandensis]|uniref:hypothetical protein n=1 Tax=Burkholderia thailandensis TaxID=57975 RepID=UPI001E386F55|nr:hypothetical protein [Burkholderia thailandensis]